VYLDLVHGGDNLGRGEEAVEEWTFPDHAQRLRVNATEDEYFSQRPQRGRHG
jgi:hypothetical protein